MKNQSNINIVKSRMPLIIKELEVGAGFNETQQIKLNQSQISLDGSLTQTTMKEYLSPLKFSNGKKANKLTEMRVIRKRTNISTMRN